MARLRTAKAAAFNIHLDDPPEGGYEKLIRRWSSLGEPVSVYGDTHMMMARPKSAGTDYESWLTGWIAKFILIEADGSWFDINNQKILESEEVSVSLPENFGPNAAAFSYVLIPEMHVLVAQTQDAAKRASVNMISRLLTKLSQHKSIKEEFGAVEITPIPTENSLDEIYQMHKIRRLEIVVERPNPDEWGDKALAVRNRMARQKATRFTQELKAASGESIKPDDETRELAEIGRDHGEVIAEGNAPDGASISESTRDYPMELAARYDPDARATSSVVLELASQLLEELRGRNGDRGQ